MRTDRKRRDEKERKRGIERRERERTRKRSEGASGTEAGKERGTKRKGRETCPNIERKQRRLWERCERG